MIGKGLKNFAAANGLTVKNGVAYGIYRGVAITLNEGIGWKGISAAVRFETEEQVVKVRRWLSNEDRQTTYRIRGYSVSELSARPGSVTVAIVDNPGTMKLMEEFLNLFADMLREFNVKSVGICHSCGMPDEGTCEILSGGTVFRLHDSCTVRMEDEIKEEQEAKRASGSLALGTLGAILGAIVGVIPWVAVYCFGYMASALGLLIGISAKKGYELSRGRETKAKGIVILVCVLLAVILAEFVGIVAANFADAKEAGMTLAETVEFVYDWAVTDGLTAVIRELAIGWLFALLGIGKLLMETFESTASKKPTRM